MITSVGDYRCRKWGLPIAMFLISIVAIANDLRLSADLSPPWKRAVPAAIVILVFAVITGGNRSALGFCRPQQTALHWLRIAAILASIMLLYGSIGIALVRFQFPGINNIPLVVTDPQDLVFRATSMCLTAPVLEEAIYRLILCVPIARFSPALAIMASGATFAGLHFLYGNPGIDNFFAGYLLAWLYLKSGSIFVPIAFHAGGNAIILSLQVAAWHFLNMSAAVGG